MVGFDNGVNESDRSEKNNTNRPKRNDLKNDAKIKLTQYAHAKKRSTTKRMNEGKV